MLFRSLLSNHKEYAAAAAAKKPIPFVPGASATATAMGLNLFRCTPPTGYSIASSRWMSANNALAALRFAFHQADFDGPEYLQAYVDKMETMAEVQMERGNIELAKAYIRAGMAHGYGAIWSTLRFGFPVAKAELVVSNALRSPDKINRQPNYLRTAAGMFFGSLENSIQ